MFRKYIVLTLIIVFTLSVGLGIGYAGSLMGHGAHIFGCAGLDEGTLLCTMDPLAHIGEWNNLFAAIISTLFSLLTVAAIVHAAAGSRRVIEPHPPGHRIRLSYETSTLVHDPLRRFIARGLMHPKIF